MTEYARQLTSGGGKPGQGYPMVFFESEASSQESVASTSASSGPVCTSCSRPRPTRTGETCCDPTGPTSPATRTWSVWQEAEWGMREYPNAGTLRSGRMPGAGAQLIFSAEDSPAKTSPLPDDGQDSQAPDRPSSSSSHESLTLFGQPGSSLRMFPDYFPPTVDGISPSFTRRWPTSGMGWPGESWTLDTSECPNDAVESSLSDILEPEVPSRFFLSSKAAAGILRRAEKRGRLLPAHLRAALEQVTTTSKTSRTEP